MAVPPNLPTTHVDNVGERIGAVDINDLARAANSTTRVVNVQSKGAIPTTDPVAGPDSTAAFQAALTAAGQGGVVYVPSAAPIASQSPFYKITSTLNWDQGQYIIGDGMDFSNLIWFGTAGGTMIRRTGSNSQGGTHGVTSGGRGILSYDLNVASWPATIIDFANPVQPVIDYAMRIDNTRMGFCSGDCISIPNGWWNAWFNNIRFDGVAGYWINATAPSTQNLSTFIVGPFTADATPAATTQWGFRFDTSASTGAAGLIAIQGARIECTPPVALAANSATVTLKSNTTLSQAWNLVMRDLVIDKGNATTGTYSLINHIGNVNGGQLSFDLQNIRFGFTPSTPLIIGNVPAALTQPTLANEISRWVYQSQADVFGSGITVNNLGGFAASDNYVTVDAAGHFHRSALGPAS